MKPLKSKYKHVCSYWSNGKTLYWNAQCRRTIGYKKHSIRKSFKNERDAALGIDKFLISINEEPVNILKRKQ